MKRAKWGMALLGGLLSLMLTSDCQALNGVYRTSYGAKSGGMGGVGVALPQEALSTLYNPAAGVHMKQRLDSNQCYFYLDAEVAFRGNLVHEFFTTPNAIGIARGDPGNPLLSVEAIQDYLIGEIGFSPYALFQDLRLDDDGPYSLGAHRHNFLLEMGYNHPLSDSLAVGFTLSPLHGGWIHGEVQWKIDEAFGGAPIERVRLSSMYMTLTPNLSHKICDQFSWGAGIDLVYAAVKIKGFDTFAGYLGAPGVPPVGSVSPENASNNGYDWAYGIAGRLGVMWQPCECVNLGLSAVTETYMTPFSKYIGAISNKGKANIPPRLDAGIAWFVLPTTVLSCDVGYIFNSATPQWNLPGIDDRPVLLADGPGGIYNPVNPVKPNQHGAKRGAGFGWRDQWVVRFGGSHDVTDQLTVRCGTNWAQVPLKKRWVAASIIAPTVIEWHLSFGASYVTKGGGHWTLCYERGFEHTFKGSRNTVPVFAGGGAADLTANSHMACLGYGMEM